MPSPSQPISPAARIAAVLGYQPETAANEFVHAVADIVTDNEDIAVALDAAYRARDVHGHCGVKSSIPVDPHLQFMDGCRNGQSDRGSALAVLRQHAPDMVEDLLKPCGGGGFLEACRAGDVIMALRVADANNRKLLPYFLAYCQKKK